MLHKCSNKACDRKIESTRSYCTPCATMYAKGLRAQKSGARVLIQHTNLMELAGK